jgi:hypothetical protein
MRDSNLELDVDGEKGEAAGDGGNDGEKSPKKKKSMSPHKRTAGYEGDEPSPKKRRDSKKTTVKVEEDKVGGKDEDADDAGTGYSTYEA